MIDLGNEQPSEQGNNKPPKRDWEAVRRDRFFDLKFSHYIEIGLTAALVGIAYFQYQVYTRQAGIMDAQTRILKIDKRPWIKNTVTLFEPIRFVEWNKQKSVVVSLHFELKNYGESPAINVQVGVEIIPHPGNTRRSELNAPQKRICQDIRDQATKNPISGLAIFPGDAAPIELKSGIGNIYQTSEPILFAALGCVTYMFAETERGETGFRMILGHDEEGQVAGLSFIEGSPESYKRPIAPELLAKGYPAKPPNVGLMQPGDVIFRPDVEGNYAK
jgi:hypothetical protein